VSVKMMATTIASTDSRIDSPDWAVGAVAIAPRAATDEEVEGLAMAGIRGLLWNIAKPF
jgi:hypothetical protein